MWLNTGLLYEWKKWWLYPVVWMGDVALASSGISKRCYQCNFSGILKGRQIIPEPYRNSKYPIRRLVCWHKTLLDEMWTQAYSEPL